MNFVWSTLRVNNIEESIRFYEEVIGLKAVNRIEAGNEVSIAFLKGSDSKTMVELLCDNSGREINVGEDISWGFSVESLEETIAFLKDRSINFEGPIEPGPGTRFIFIKDPNGMKVQLVEG